MSDDIITLYYRDNWWIHTIYIILHISFFPDILLPIGSVYLTTQ